MICGMEFKDYTGYYSNDATVMSMKKMAVDLCHIP